MSGEALREINAHVTRLEDLAKKYECEITIVNGDKCP